MKGLSHRQKTKWSQSVTLEKQLRAKVSELHALYEARRGIKAIPLEYPIQQGWKKSFTLREDAANRKDAKRLREILRVINTTIVSGNRDFTRKKSKGVVKPIPHNIGYISVEEWKRREYPEEWRKYFKFTIHYHRGWWGSPWTEEVWEFKYPYYFVPIIRKNMLTHYTPLDAEIEQKIAEIEHFMERNNYWPKWSHMFGQRAHCWDDWDREGRIEKRLIEREIAEEKIEENDEE